jgi:hypothetical protein
MERYYDNTTASAVKCSSWLRYRRRRPAFMEPLVGGPLGVPPGVPPPHDGYERPLRMSSSFPLKDDAGYIGYLTDDDERSGGSGGDDIMSVVRRRRRELLGPDISFTMCCLLVLMVMMVMMVMVWGGFRWGFRPPATVTTFDRPGGGFAPP